MTNIKNGKNNLTVALDIGTTKVCAIVGKKNQYGKIEVFGVGRVVSEGVSRGVVSNIDKTVRAIKEAMEVVSKVTGETYTKVHVGIAGQHIKSLHHHGLIVREDGLKEIREEDVDKLINDMHKLVLPPGDKILHVIPQEFKVDDEEDIIDPIGMSGVRLEANFHIITGQLAASRNILRCIDKVGLDVVDMTLEPIASAAAVLSDEEKEAGVVLVDIGGGTTDISIFKDDIIRHTAVIPFGGNIITKDIIEGCTVMKDQAEKLKVRFGSALASAVVDNRIITIPGIRGRDQKEISEKNLARIIEARMEEIFDFVMWEVKRSGYEGKLIAGIVLTGGGSLLKDINKLVESHTGLHSRVGRPIDHFAHGYSAALASPIYATAVGLLVRSLEGTEYEEEVVENETIEATLDESHLELEHVGNEEEDESFSQKMMSKLFKLTKDYFVASPDDDF